MDATTPPRGDDEPAGGTASEGQAAAPPPLIEPEQPPVAGVGSTAVDAAAARSAGPAPAAAADDGPEDPSVPDTAAETTVTTEPVGSRAEEPVVPGRHPEEVRVAAPEASAGDAPDGQARTGTERANAPEREIVYVAAPSPPKDKGNRGFGALLAVLAALVYLVLYALFAVLIRAVTLGDSSIAFLGDASFYIPVALFALAFVLLALVVNRGGWWSFVLGSLFVGIFVYLGTIGMLLAINAADLTPADAAVRFRQFLTNPLVIAAGLVAREVALWVGAGISARGRRVKARNVAARAEFDREEAERRAEFERFRAGAAPA